MEQEKGKWFVKIPSFIITDDRLNNREKLFFGSVIGFNLQSIYENKPLFTPSYDYFSNLFNVSRQTISNWVDNLVDCGYINKSTAVIPPLSPLESIRMRNTLYLTKNYFNKVSEVYVDGTDNSIKWYLFLPGDIVVDAEIGATSKRLLGDLACMCYTANNNKYSSLEGVDVTNERIATIYNVSEQTASNCVSELEKHGYIQRILRPTAEGTERTIRLSEECCESFRSVNCPNPYVYVSPKGRKTQEGKEATDKPKPKRTTSYDKYKEDIEEVIGYLNEKTGKKFRPTSNCNYTDLVRVFKQEYTVADCKKVIDNKFREWKGTDFEQYLRPKTLFGNKFDTYLNAEYRMSEQTRQHNLGTYMTEDGTPIHVATGQVKVEDI